MISKQLCIIGYILGLVPINRIKQTHYKVNLHRLYCVILMIILFLGNNVSIYLRWKSAYINLTSDAMLMDASSQTAASFLSIISIYVSIFKHPHDFKTSRALYKDLTRYLRKYQISHQYYTEFMVVHLYCILLLAFGVAISTEEENLAYLIQYGTVYYSCITVLFYYVQVVTIGKILRNFNDNILTTSIRSSLGLTKSQALANHIYTDSKGHVGLQLQAIYQLRMYYVTTSKLIGNVNNIFGSQILLLTITVVFALLELTSWCVAVLVDKHHLFKDKSLLQYELFLYALVYSGAKMIMGVVVAIVCEETTKEAEKTGTICYTLLLEVPVRSNNEHHRVLREELILLAQQATHQCPYFSAMGFFRIDYAMLLGLLGSVTSYIIVLIQLNK